ncbi:uncharacterized protein Pyn_36193 [Prunus yedoensis var. nudiflora]|uniref:Uncharacterized protein n=1 Tax=Prunus yedoensis var. nudiflora TaxID=2094558 RepID=A0A314YN95_PRUYE|nr:uncharacterized protein Pyn_36193 [Prunus yedoensis var. nudiflora]
MAPTTTNNHIHSKPPKPNSTVTTTTKKPLVCFSFAAYAKSLINHLKSLLSTSQSSKASPTQSSPPSKPPSTSPSRPTSAPFSRKASPWAPPSPTGVPHPSSSSASSSASRPSASSGESLAEASGASRGAPSPLQAITIMLTWPRKLLVKAPVLVPVYRNCYVPSRPGVAGNPVLYVDAENVTVLSCDVTRFFCQEFGFAHVPVWAPKTTRWIDFWSEVVARGETRGWWSGNECLGGCLEEVFWRLREGGWGEEEVREMMMMDGVMRRFRREGPT